MSQRLGAVRAKGKDSGARFRAGGWFRSMMRNGAFEIEEVGSDRYCSLEEAQRAALPHLAELVASIVRQGIEQRRFVVVDGVVSLVQRSQSQGLAKRGFTNGENRV